MSWSYSGNPAASALDEVRFLIADTSFAQAWTLQDEEINYTLGLYSASPPVVGQNFLAAAVCAETILGKFKSTMIDSQRIGDLSISLVNQVRLYESLAYRLRQRAALQMVPPYIGGTSIQEKYGLDADPDRVQPAVKIDGMSYASPVNAETGDSSPSGP